LAYAAGMAMLLIVLTLTLAAARRGFLSALRRVLPHIQRVSGGIMALVGLYLLWWGIYEIRMISRDEWRSGAGPVDMVTGWSTALQHRLSDLDAVQVALVLGLVIAVTVLAALIRADRRGSDTG